jgi:hypothetical protein
MSASTAPTTVVVSAAPPALRPCYRHSAHRWLAYCDDCTAWHLGRQIAARTRVAPVLTLVSPVDHRPARALRPAA